MAAEVEGARKAPVDVVEAIGQPVKFPGDKYDPMALGPLGRGWAQRACHAGTYDERWLKDDFPFLPKDFDERYYQAAPEDQQIPHPKGTGVDIEMESHMLYINALPECVLHADARATTP